MLCLVHLYVLFFGFIPQGEECRHFERFSMPFRFQPNLLLSPIMGNNQEHQQEELKLTLRVCFLILFSLFSPSFSHFQHYECLMRRAEEEEELPVPSQVRSIKPCVCLSEEMTTVICRGTVGRSLFIFRGSVCILVGTQFTKFL